MGWGNTHTEKKPHSFIYTHLTCLTLDIHLPRSLFMLNKAICCISPVPLSAKLSNIESFSEDRF